MGTTAARRAGPILENTCSVSTYELLAACQGVDLRRAYENGLSRTSEAVYGLVREKVPLMETDREIWPDIRAVEKLVREDTLLRLVEDLEPPVSVRYPVRRQSQSHQDPLVAALPKLQGRVDSGDGGTADRELLPDGFIGVAL